MFNKIIKWFQPLNMKVTVDGKEYKLWFTDCICHILWEVSVVDAETKKSIGTIEIKDRDIINKNVEMRAKKKIRKLLEDTKYEREQQEKRKEAMKYYFGV